MTNIFYNFYDELVILLQKNNIAFKKNTNSLMSKTCKLILIDANDWSQLGAIAASIEARLVAIWAKQIAREFQINVTFEKAGQYLVFRANILENKLEISSLASFYAAADRTERHIHDMFGINFNNHPNLIRWTRHAAWSEQEFPLRKNFIPSTIVDEVVPPDSGYPFAKIEGSSVCEIPVGPVHAGIIEPGHFRFHIAGEDIINLEERLGYVHKGIEKLAEGKSVHELIRLAGRISGDSTVAHAWAACQACESAAKINVPTRALFIRAIMAERERIANHLGDIGAICNDVGFAFAYYQFSRLRELWQRLNHDIFGHRFMMDCILFGGVKENLNNDSLEKLIKQILVFKDETKELFSIINNNNSLMDRLETTGILTVEIAKKIGAVGYVGRASGSSYDLRSNIAYTPYDQIKMEIPSTRQGDVAARMNLREQEITVSLNVLNELIEKLPKTNFVADIISAPIKTEGLGLIEGWRGEILTYVSFDDEGKIDRFFPRDPSWLNWLALEYLVHGNIVPDFPVCNKSINGSYSGHDL